MYLLRFKLVASRVLAVGLLVLGLAGAGFGWNRAGHMVTGALAADRLKALDPAALDRVVKLLRAHPAYDKWMKAVGERKGLDDEAVILFEMAARWADDARGTQYAHDAWHFIDFPFKPVGEPASVVPDQPNPENITVGFNESVKTLSDPKKTDQEKAIALAWIFHLTGDAHQPLHATSLFTTQYPKGDRGGNSFWVYLEKGGDPVKLHSFWDGLVLGSENFQDVHNEYLSLKAAYPAGGKTINVLKLDTWLAESLAIAKESVYMNGKLKGGSDKTSAVQVPDDYVKAAKKMGEIRVCQASYRLAALLKSLV
jgi:S1/P1 Nuclease